MQIETPKVEHAFTVLALLSPLQVIGASHAGVLRVFPIIGGTFEGPRIRGDVVPGGADWQTIRRDGTMVLDARYAIKSSDGALIQVHNRGLLSFSPQELQRLERGEIFDASGVLRTAAEFLAPAGPHEWLNKSIFVSTIRVTPEPIDRVWVSFFEVK